MTRSRIVAVTGARGQLGTDVCAVFATAGWKVAAIDQAELDLETADADAVEIALGSSGAPAAIVHCAAYTNVDKAESNAPQAFRLNALAAREVARAAARLDAHLIQISTDYVFSGAKGAPYVEEDAPGPIQVYGVTKLAGEYFALAEAPRCAVVRSCGLYGANPSIGKGGANFVQKVLERARTQGEIEVVDDEFVAPTRTVDLAAQLLVIAERRVTGVVHATAHGPVSWFEFALAAVEIAAVKANVKRTSAARFKAPARRPAFSALTNARLSKMGLDHMPSCRDGLYRYLRATQGRD